MRVEWLKGLQELLLRFPECSADTEVFVTAKLADPEETVRVAAIELIGLVSVQFPGLMDEETLKVVAVRCKDKKGSARAAALHALGAIYESTRGAEIESCAWIPGVILRLVYLDDAETTVMVEKSLVEVLMPPLSDHEARTMRVLNVLQGLDSKENDAFVSVLTRMASCRTNFGLFVDHCVIVNVLFD